MANYNNLKATINANIKANGNEEITGPILNTVLNQAVTTLGAGYQYMGVATPATSPGTPDANVFYIAATPGTYTNFGGKVVADGEVAILKYNGSWAKEVTGAATAAQVTQLGQDVEDNTENILNLQQEVDSIQPIVIEGNVTNAPDEEDLTTDENDLLKFANRSTAVNQMGYVILRKNKTFAEQVTAANTIYEIRYNFDLGGESVTIPDGCVLKFEGGMLSNGILIAGENCTFSKATYKIFEDVVFRGFACEYIDVRWFGAISGNLNDDASAYFQKAFDCGEFYPAIPILVIGSYYIASTIVIRNHFQLIGNNYTTRAFKTNLPAETKVESSIHVAQGVTAFDIVGYDAEGYSYTSFKIANIKFIGDTERTAILFNVSTFGGPGRPISIHECEMSYFASVLHIDNGVDTNTSISVVSIDGCNIFQNASVITTNEATTGATLSSLNIYDNVIEQNHAPVFRIYNPGSYIYIHNNLLEGQRDWVLEIPRAYRQCEIEITKNAFEGNKNIVKLISPNELFIPLEMRSNTRVYFSIYENYVFTSTVGSTSDARFVLQLQNVVVNRAENVKNMDFREDIENVTYFEGCYFPKISGIGEYPMTCFKGHNGFEEIPVTRYRQPYHLPLRRVQTTTYSSYNGYLSVPANTQLTERITTSLTKLALIYYSEGGETRIQVLNSSTTFFDKYFYGPRFHLIMIDTSEFEGYSQGEELRFTMKVATANNIKQCLVDINSLPSFGAMRYLVNHANVVVGGYPYPSIVDNAIPLLAKDANDNDILWTGDRWVKAKKYSAFAYSSGNSQSYPTGTVGRNYLGPEDIGFRYFDTQLGKNVYAKSINAQTGVIQWVEGDGEVAGILRSGTTAQRPTPTKVGFTYFDTTLGKMIVWNGSAWVNMDGSALS